MKEFSPRKSNNNTTNNDNTRRHRHNTNKSTRQNENISVALWCVYTVWSSYYYSPLRNTIFFALCCFVSSTEIGREDIACAQFFWMCCHVYILNVLACYILEKVSLLDSEGRKRNDCSSWTVHDTSVFRFWYGKNNSPYILSSFLSLFHVTTRKERTTQLTWSSREWMLRE